MNQLLYQKKITQLMIQHHDFVAVTVTAMQGSAPQEPGAKMIVTTASTQNPYYGTIGGGKLELFAIKHAQAMLDDKSLENTESMTLNLQSDLGMTCGGVVQLFFETYQQPQWHIAVFGAGHVAQALIPLLLTLDCHVYCIDSRTQWLEQISAHPSLTTINDDDITQVMTKLPNDAFMVSVTRGHCEDVKIIQSIIQDRVPPYIGVIGSDSKAVILTKELLDLGVERAVVEQIHCPIGLSLGKDTPAEIAISISAQLLKVRDQNTQS